MATLNSDNLIRRVDLSHSPLRPTTVVALHPEVYEKFEAQFRLIQPNEQTTAIQVGYSLGVQAVLKALRGALVAA
jgi:hypothetical protein